MVLVDGHTAGLWNYLVFGLKKSCCVKVKLGGGKVWLRYGEVAMVFSYGKVSGNVYSW